MDTDDVTLVVPCYNVESTLPHVLESIDQLAPSPATVLCVDDGSTDGTREILRDHHGSRHIRHEENRGLSATLNTALSHVSTPLFAKVDADLVVPSNWLAIMLRELKENEVDLVQGFFREDVTTLGDKWRALHTYPDFSSKPRLNYPINGSNILAYTDALRDIDGWDERYQRANDDVNLMQRLVYNGYNIYYSPDVESTHIRTDTWKDALRAAWAYSKVPMLGGEPTQFSDLLSWIPKNIYLSILSLKTDHRNRAYVLMWISFLRAIYHTVWDLECILNQDGKVPDRKQEIQKIPLSERMR
ncbi:glycosyltransferase family 2 protein [Natrarchaeobaculum sulfurireducens]|nr:glycosyltransferase family 2 protein [Natrarchaeobaculum sulfurireducens]